MKFTIHRTEGEKVDRSYFVSTTSTRFMDTYTLASQLQQRAHLCAWLETGRKLGTFSF